MSFLTFKKKDSDLPPLYIKNTLTRELEEFVPLSKDQVTIYTCGPTAYDFAHIGNLRAYVFSDILKRTLLLNGYDVNHTINITDFGHLSGDGDDGEDKMVIAIKREGKPHTMASVKEIAQIYSEAFKQDMDALGIMPPTQYTPASDFINEEIALVKELDQKGYTYTTSDGVYFDISHFPTYGRLGNINLEALKEGARVAANPEKKHPADFAVWKFGELGWESPWGKGFPGWHIECTAMAFATLGNQIDIHTGGIDHIATHHNGEIAQAEAATGKTYVKYWMHNAFITLDQKRIGKSVGNAIYLKTLVEHGYDPLAYRYWLLTGHYSSPMDFTFEALDGAKQAHFKLRRFVYGDLKDVTPGTIDENYTMEFFAAINNDLDTPAAIALLWQLVKDKNISDEDKLATIRFFDTTLNLGLSEENDEAAHNLGVISLESLSPELQSLIKDREKARSEKRWADADILRQQINNHGYLVVDTEDGTVITKSA